MTEKRFSAQIGYDNDFIKDNQTGNFYDSFKVADMMNYLIEENQRLAKGMKKVIAQKMESDREIRRLKHEVYGK